MKDSELLKLKDLLEKEVVRRENTKKADIKRAYVVYKSQDVLVRKEDLDKVPDSVIFWMYDLLTASVAVEETATTAVEE